MRCEVLAVGTELLLGQVVDSNSARIGERLALAGIDCVLQTRVGDNVARIAEALRGALSRADAVIVCGGLGPTPDDVTREALAEVSGGGMSRDPAMVERIRAIFAERGRTMPESNARQADRPEGAELIEQAGGTAPGLVMPVGDRIVYAVPGVPWEMEDMLDRAVMPDLVRRAGPTSTIVSRTLRTWGLSESALAETLADRVARQANPTIAFLASGAEGIKVRITAKAASEVAAGELLDAEEAELRALLGDVVFGVDDESMERVVAGLLTTQSRSLGVAESLTGGLVGARLAEVPGSSQWFRGSIVAYDSKVKFDLLGVPEGPVVSAEAASAMAVAAARVLEADVGLGVTGVAGPATQEGQPVGTVFAATSFDGRTEVTHLRLPGDRPTVRQLSVISLLDLLRRRLMATRSSSPAHDMEAEWSP